MNTVYDLSPEAVEFGIQYSQAVPEDQALIKKAVETFQAGGERAERLAKLINSGASIDQIKAELGGES